MQHFHDSGEFFSVLDHHFEIVSGCRPAEYSFWKRSQNKYSPAWGKIMPGVGKSHNRAIIQHRATQKQRMKSVGMG